MMGLYIYIYYVYVGCPCIETNAHCLHRCTAHAWKNIFILCSIQCTIYTFINIYIYTHIWGFGPSEVVIFSLVKPVNNFEVFTGFNTREIWWGIKFSLLQILQIKSNKLKNHSETMVKPRSLYYPTQTMHCYKGDSSKLPWICIVWYPTKNCVIEWSFQLFVGVFPVK